MTFLLACTLAVIIFGNVEADGPQRIVGGKHARDREFPYTVSIMYDGLHWCAGAIISNSHILTAAHCLLPLRDFPIEMITVLSGTTQLSRGGQVTPVKEFYYHPLYDSDGVDWSYDVGVVKLAVPLVFNMYQTKIDLPTSKPEVNSFAIVSGWGSINDPYVEAYENLQKAILQIIPTNTCEDYLDMRIEDTMICTYVKKHVGTCTSDSGSPLVSNKQVVGIVSGGFPCALGFPDVYTNVHMFIDDIKYWLTK